MLWLYRLQQRLSITRRESWAIFSLLALFLLGLAVQEVERYRTPPISPKAVLVARPDTASDSPEAATPATVPATAPATPDKKEAIIDLNRASPRQLQALPGIGPALAGRIVRYRSRRSFQSPDELERVSGIGPKTMDRLRPLVSVSTEADEETDDHSAAEPAAQQ